MDGDESVGKDQVAQLTVQSRQSGIVREAQQEHMVFSIWTNPSFLSSCRASRTGDTPSFSASFISSDVTPTRGISFDLRRQ